MTCQERQDLIPLYALGALEPPERDALRDHVEAGCPTCGPALAEAQATAAQLALTLEPIAPPTAVRARLMRRIDAGGQAANTGGRAASGTLGASGATRDRSFWADWGRSLTAAAAAAAVVYFAISIAMDHRADRLQKRLALLESQLTEMQSTQRQTEQSINLQQQRGASLQLVALEGTPDAPGAKALVFWDRPRGIWHMYAFGLNPPGNAKEYELWYIVGDQKIPAGSFNVTPNGEALLTTKLPPNLGNVTLAAITDEPIGQPHLQPTGKIRLAGPIVQ